MNTTQSKAILAALSDEVRAERQRVVDLAVRAARRSGYCEQFNVMIAELYPELTIEVGGYTVAVDTDGRPCASRHEDAWTYYGARDSRPSYGEDGYDRNGFDRDGFNRVGYDADGFDANDQGRSRSRTMRRTRWTDENGQEQAFAERVYSTGYGETTHRDAAGNLRPARPATAEEAIAEATEQERYNPTTWAPTVAPQETPSETVSA